MLTDTLRQFFPNSLILDAALKFPITPAGWDVEMPGPDQCRFDQEDFWLILNLQDMLTGGWGKIPHELKAIHNYYQSWAPLDRIIVVVWPQGIAESWIDNSFHLVEFSTHQYETWQSYLKEEDVLRDTFSDGNKDFEFNFLCMNRIAKPHRKILYSRMESFRTGNCSLQAAGHELKYGGINFKTYDEQYNNLVNLLSLKQAFNTSLFSVVSESQYGEQYGIITEKTFNAIVAGHPFLICGHAYALEHIRNLGFKTYDRIFEEDYDTRPNNSRLDDMMFDNLGWFENKLTSLEMQDFYFDLADTIDYNRNFFFEDFGDKQKSCLRTQLLNIWNQHLC
jgi:hypothetical protein